MTPLFSGYRDERHELRFTTSYAAVYGQLAQEGVADPVGASEVSVVIELVDILTLSHFDMELYRRFKPPPANP